VNKIKNILKKCTPLRHGQYLSSDGVVSEWSPLPRSMKLDIIICPINLKILEWMSPSWQSRLIKCLQTRVLYRILNLGVLKYEWGSGSAEPGAQSAPPRMVQPCCGWVREDRSPLPPKGSGVMTPGKIYEFYMQNPEFWCTFE
jgi:hypothetical protein